MRPRKPGDLGLGRRGYPSARGKQPGPEARHIARTGANFWEGRDFFVQVDRCQGLSEAVTVSLDEDRYAQCSKRLQDGIDAFFDGLVPVVLVDVPVHYALEVRLLADEFHPRHGRCYLAKDGEPTGAVTIFSKLQSKKWPKLENVIQQIQDFCRVPVRIQLVGKELQPSRGPEEGKANARAGPSEPPLRSVLAPVTHATIHVVHAQGKHGGELHTGVDGKAELVCFPGKYLISGNDAGSHDRLSPNMVEVPARFSAVEVTIVASLKKECVFLVIDHLNRPFPRFPLRLELRGSQQQSMTVVTKANGQGKLRLGCGVYVATHRGHHEASTSPTEPPVAPFTQDFEVQDVDTTQVYRINVQRTRFDCEIMLRTRCDEPAAGCPFEVVPRHGRKSVAKGTCTKNGLASCALPVGSFSMVLEPGQESAFVPGSFDVQTYENGTWSCADFIVETKTVDVRVQLVTPDGEPAPGCNFVLSPGWSAEESKRRVWDVSLTSDDDGIAIANLLLLEPYVFCVKHSRRAAEYMPQRFSFQTDRRRITIVVARSIFGFLPEDRLALLVDTSGSMQAYIKDIKEAMNNALAQQFWGSSKHFNVAAFTEKFEEFQPQLVECTQENVEDAMKFCESLRAGGGSELFGAVSKTLRLADLEAMYLVTDGKCDVGDHFLNRVRALYLNHPKRPKINVICINVVPRRPKYEALQALALATRGMFRPICLEQDHSEVSAFFREHHMDIGSPGSNLSAAALAGLGCAPLVGATTTDDETGETGEDADEAEQFYDSA